MAGERMVPILPCGSIDEIQEFFLLFDFEVTYRQVKPNPYLALRREDIELHYFALAGFQPEDSYSTCGIFVPDTKPLFDVFAAGLRTRYGKLPMTGFPRITRPRKRRNEGYLSGFSLIDPSGNWIRVMQDKSRKSAADDAVPPSSKLASAVANAVVLADSKGDVAQAAKILDGAVARSAHEATDIERIEALAYLAELSVRLDRIDRARELVEQVEALASASSDPGEAQAAVQQARDLLPAQK